MSDYSSPFTYQLYDLYSGRYLGHLPLQGVTFGSQLNQPGQLNGSVDTYDPRVQALDPYVITTPGRTCLCVDYAGVIVWAGMILQAPDDWQPGQCKLTINAQELWAYLSQRVQATDYSAPPYSGITGLGTKMAIWDATATDAQSVYDPVLMAWQIVYDALYLVSYGGHTANILGGLSIAANSAASVGAYLATAGATNSLDYINATYPYPSLQQIATIVGQLMQNGLNVGFDSAIDVAYSGLPGSPPIGTVNFSTPRRGQLYADSGLVLNAANALSMQIPPDGTQAGNTIYEEGQSGSLVVTQNASPAQQGWPLLEQIISHAQIQSANVLEVLTALGLSDLFIRSYPVVTPSVTLDLFDPSLPIGSYIVGDDVWWTVPATDGTDSGVPFHPRFPTGYAAEWRIVGYSATVADEGVSTNQIQLALPPATSISAPPF